MATVMHRAGRWAAFARLLIALPIIALVTACVGSNARTAPIPDRDRPAVTATLARAPGGQWLLTYEFRRPAPAWLFNRTNPSIDGEAWRAASWTVVTPGVRLERRGASDLLVGEGGPLRTVTISVRPYQLPLRADYTPFVPFSDGGAAIYSGHFALIPVDRLDDAAVQQAVSLDPPPYEVVVRDRGNKLLVNGIVTADAGSVGEGVAETYIYSGPSPVLEAPAFAAIVDPGLPGWIREELGSFLPRLLELYRQRMGRPATARPMVLAAWGGNSTADPSFSGSVRPGLVTLEFAGARLSEPSEAMRARVRGFLAHETAHFWIGHTIRYESRSDAWITEGGANLVAIRALQALFPEYDHVAALAREARECLAQVGAGVPLAEAVLRGGRAPYGCGAMLLAAAERDASAARPRVDAFSFIAALIDKHRAEGAVSREEWLTHFEEATGDPERALLIRRFIEAGVADPEAFLTGLSQAVSPGSQ